MNTRSHHLLKGLNQLLSYIETNTHETITADDCANIAHVSKYYLMHVFKKATGYTIMEYIKLRRLANSLDDLKLGDLRIIDIALKYGFAHEQSFIRAFNKAFDITPGKYRRNSIPLNITHPIVLKECFETENGLVFKPKIIYLPTLYLVGIKHNLTNKKNLVSHIAKSVAHDFYFNYSEKISNTVNNNVYYGYTWHNANDLSDNNYMPALEVESLQSIPNNMNYVTLKSSKYAVFTYIGHHSIKDLGVQHLMSLHNVIDNEFSKKHNYNFVKQGGFFFERIDMSVSSDNYCEVELYYPIS